MAKTKIEVDLVIKGGDSVEQVELKTKSLKTQLKEMKALLASGTLDNEAFNRISKEAGKLQDKIGDVNQQVKNLSSDAQKLDGFISITQGIVGGFAAVQGITAMVGEENEDLQKTMVKLQGAMSALAGIQAVANTLNKTSAAYTTANTIATNVSTFAQKRYAMAVGTSTGVMKAFRIVGATLGIGLIVAGIAALVTNFDKLKTTVSKFLPSLETLAKGFKIAYNAVTDFIGISSDATRKVDELEKANIKKNKTLQNEIDILEAMGGKEEQIYRKKSLMISNNILLLERQKLQGIVSQEEYQTKIEELRQEDRVLEAEHDKQVLDGKKKTGDKKVAIEKKVNEQIKDDRTTLAEETNKEFIESQMSDEEKIKARYASRLELAKMDFETTRQLLILQNNELKTLQDEKDKEQKEAKKKADDEKLAEDKRIGEERIAQQKAIESARISIVNDSYLALNSLGELALGQQFKNTAVGKSLALAQIATDTALGFIQGLRIAQQTAVGTGPAAAFTMPVFYASQVAAVLGAANKAKSLLGGGGSVSAPSSQGGGGMSSQPPRIDTYQANRTPMNANQRVYVLEKDITDSQGRVARIRHNATLI